MARNTEIKARLPDFDATRRRVAALAEPGPRELHQKDTFFHAYNGRLKLRVLSDGGAELIGYTRPDRKDPSTSEYFRCDCPDPEQIERLLTRTLGIRGVVLKRRSVYHAGRTRIHLDRVEGLGDFLELEVVLEPGEDSADGEKEARRLMARLRIDDSHLVDRAYIDLLEDSSADPGR